MELSSFEFSLHLFLLIYSRTIVIDRYGIFTALEKDVYKLRWCLNFITGMKTFCVGTAVCDLHKVFHRVHII